MNTYAFECDVTNFKEAVLTACKGMLHVATVDATKAGFGVEQLLENNHSWVLSKLRLCCYKSKFNNIEISTWVNEWKHFLTTRNFSSYKGGETNFLAVSEWALIDFSTRQAVNLNCLGGVTELLSKEPSPLTKPKKVQGVTDGENYQYIVTEKDIDINQHVSTVSYIAMILSKLQIPDNITNITMNVNFLHEALLQDVLTISYIQNSEGSKVEITNGMTSLCRAELSYSC